MKEEFVKVILYLPNYLTDLFSLILRPGKLFNHEESELKDVNKNAVRFNYISMGLASLFMISLLPGRLSLLAAVLFCFLFFIIQALINVVFTFIIMKLITGKMPLRLFVSVQSFYNGVSIVLVALLAMISLGIFKALGPACYAEFLDSVFFNAKGGNLAFCNAFEISTFIFTGGIAFIILWSKLAWEACRLRCGIKKTAFCNFLAAWNVFFIPVSLSLFFLIISLL